jgi:hypothetical protein
MFERSKINDTRDVTKGQRERERVQSKLGVSFSDYWPGDTHTRRGVGVVGTDALLVNLQTAKTFGRE